MPKKKPINGRKRKSAHTMLLLVKLQAKGLDCDAIAEAIGSSRRSVYRWLAGESVPIPALYAALERLLETRRA